MPAAKRRSRKAGWRRVSRNGKAQRKRKKVLRVPWRTHGDGTGLLALDFSSACTGWAYFQSGRLKEYGKYRLLGKTHSEKLHGFLNWVLTQYQKYPITSVTFEAPYHRHRANVFGVLSMYRAVLLLAHWDVWARPFPEENQLPAHLIKKTLGILPLKGGTTAQRHDANKRMMVKTINSLYGTSFHFVVGTEKGKRTSDDDIADAVAVGHTWYTLHTSNDEEASDE